MTVLAPAVRSATVPAAGWMSVMDRFEHVAAAQPDRPALVVDGAILTFGELARRTAAVAAGLASRDVAAESIVGLLLPRCADLVVALLGTLRCGASFVPLDPALPANRLRYMCDQAGVTLLLADASTRRLAPRAVARRVLTVATCARTAPRRAPRHAAIQPAQRAYAMYTSGSTGRPKAVEVTHGSLAALLDGLGAVIGSPRARVGWNASPAFDASVQQWLRLCRGDTVVLVSESVRRDPAALAALVADERLDELDITPSHLLSLLDYLPAVRRDSPLRLLVGGEAISPSLWRRLSDQRAAGGLVPLNLYGPTECTVDATCAQINGSSGPHLGDPLPGTRVYLLDSELRPVPAGRDGELYLAGAGVSRGYLGMPALTAQRFVADAVAGDGRRMYRTGDRARLGPDGRLEYLGRCDDQAKLHGYRIELGEVEAVLGGCPGVMQAVAVVRDDLPGGAALVGYCVPSRSPDSQPPLFDGAAVRRAAAEHLPAYMVPAVLVPLDRLPLTSNGKVNRGALPVPVRAERADDDGTLLTPTERMVAAAWCALLDVGRVGAEDHFFDLGGQSLLAIQLVARLRRRAGRAIPLIAVFKYPVLREFAAYLEQELPPAG
jgi:amino acid adenylation domain-containing protein